MRHNYKGRKLGTDFSHTKAMKRSLTEALLLNDRIKTTETRAKEIRPDVDKIITWAKKSAAYKEQGETAKALHCRRLAMAALGNDKELVREVFLKVEQGMFQDRQGGYTRIMKLGNRKGDNAPMVIMELVTEPVAKKTKAEAKPAAKKATKVQPVKVEDAAAEGAGEAEEAAGEGEAAAEEAAGDAAGEDAGEATAEGAGEEAAAEAPAAEDVPAEEVAEAEEK